MSVSLSRPLNIYYKLVYWEISSRCSTPPTDAPGMVMGRERALKQERRIQMMTEINVPRLKHTWYIFRTRLTDWCHVDGVGYSEQEETLSGTCQEHVRNVIPIDVTCRVWDIRTRRNVVRNMSGTCQEHVRNVERDRDQCPTPQIHVIYFTRFHAPSENWSPEQDFPQSHALTGGLISETRGPLRLPHYVTAY